MRASNSPSLLVHRESRQHHIRHFLLFLMTASLLASNAFAQAPQRLIIFQGNDNAPPALQTASAMLITEVSALLGISDVVVLAPEGGTTYGTAFAYSDDQDGLQLLTTLIDEQPALRSVVAFVCLPNQGPLAIEIAHALNSSTTPLQVLCNAYYRSDLTDLFQDNQCGVHITAMDYGSGVVFRDDTSNVEDRGFPVVPVVVGAAGVTTGILLLTGDNGSDCTPVTATWVAPDGLCQNDDPVQLQILGTTGGNWTGSGVNSNGVFEPATGSQSITYSVGEGACLMTSSQSIAVDVPANAMWMFNDEICTGQSISLSPSGTAGGTWSGENVTDNGNGTAAFSATTAGKYSVTYAVGSGSCAALQTQVLIVLEQADASWSTSAEPCVDEVVSLSPDGTQGGTWSGEGVADQGDGTATFSQHTAGSYTITYTVGQGSCSDSHSSTIMVIDLALASWTPPKQICVDQTVQLTPDGTPGGSWTGDGVIDNGDGTAVFSRGKAGSYDVTYSVGSGNCADSQTLSLNVEDRPDASWTAPEELCTGELLLLSSDGSTKGTWSGEGISDNGDGTATFMQLVAGSYSVTYAVGHGECTAVSAQKITVVDQADASWTAPAPLCSGEMITLSPDGTAGGQWSGLGITDLGNGNATFNSENPGVYPITYTAGSGMCSDTLTLEITVLVGDDAAWDNPGSLCTDESITLTPSGTDGGTWSGEGITDNGDGTAEFLQSGEGSFTVTYSTSGACPDTITQTIVVVSAADASWEIPPTVCPGQDVALTPVGTPGGQWTGNGVTDLGDGTATFTSTEPGSVPVTYIAGAGACGDSLTQEILISAMDDASWTVPVSICTDQEVILQPDGTVGGVWSGDGVSNLGNGTAQFVQNSAGSFDVTYITNGTCADTTTQTITVDDQGDASWTIPGEPCADEILSLVPDATPGGTWSGDGVIDLGDGTATFSQSDAGEYSIGYTVGSGACEDVVVQDITVVPLPDASWLPENDMLCPGEVLDLSAPAGTWSGQNVTDFGDGLGQFQSTETGTFSITLTVGVGECQSSESHDVIVGDTEPPVISNPPEDQFVECDGTGNLIEFQTWIDNNGGGEAFDLCGGDVTWTPEVFDPGGPCPDISVTFTVCDAMQNCTSVGAVFHLEDTTSPELFDVPQDESVSCENIPGPAIVTADDICSGPAIVQMSEDIGGSCPYAITRTYTATDACGNTSEAVQVITVSDTEAPVGDPLPQLEVFCDFPCDPECLPPPQPVNFTDNCDQDIAVIFEDIPIEIQPEFQLWQRDYIGTDDCGNVGVTSQFIQVICIMGPQDPVTHILTPIMLGATPLVPHSAWQDHGTVHTLTSTAIINGRSQHTGVGLQVNFTQRQSILFDASMLESSLAFLDPSTSILSPGTLSSRLVAVRFKSRINAGSRAFITTGIARQWHAQTLRPSSASASHWRSNRYHYILSGGLDFEGMRDGVFGAEILVSHSGSDLSIGVTLRYALPMTHSESLKYQER